MHDGKEILSLKHLKDESEKATEITNDFPNEIAGWNGIRLHSSGGFPMKNNSNNSKLYYKQTPSPRKTIKFFFPKENTKNIDSIPNNHGSSIFSNQNYTENLFKFIPKLIKVEKRENLSRKIHLSPINKNFKENKKYRNLNLQEFLIQTKKKTRRNSIDIF